MRTTPGAAATTAGMLLMAGMAVVVPTSKLSKSSGAKDRLTYRAAPPRVDGDVVLLGDHLNGLHDVARSLQHRNRVAFTEPVNDLAVLAMRPGRPLS